MNILEEKCSDVYENFKSDVYVLNAPSMGRLRLLLPSMAAKHYIQAGKLRFSNFFHVTKSGIVLCNLPVTKLKITF